MSKKSRIYKVYAKLQHKVQGIFVRDEIFENIRRTQRIDKGKHNECYASLCKSFVFDWIFRKFRPEQKCLGLYVVTLRILYRFLIFWTQTYVVFFCAEALEPAKSHGSARTKNYTQNVLSVTRMESDIRISKQPRSSFVDRPTYHWRLARPGTRRTNYAACHWSPRAPVPIVKFS